MNILYWSYHHTVSATNENRTCAVSSPKQLWEPVLPSPLTPQLAWALISVKAGILILFDGYGIVEA